MADEIVAVYRAEVEQYKKAVDELVGRLDKLDKEQRTATESAKGMGVQMRGLGREIVAAFGITAGIAGFVTVMRGAFNAAKDFEAQMSKVRAVSGATNEEMKKLDASAKALGASTMFTATQVGQLQEEYAKLGFTTSEILAATEATLDLAAATGSTLAEAAEVAGATVRGFGLDASETIRVADVMGMSFNKSALDISRFRESMKLVAPIARAANIDLETTSALLGVLSNAGLSGSIAGTALKNLLSKLSDENSELSQQLGFTVRNSDDLFLAFEKLAKMNIDLTAATELTDERSKAAFITLFNGIGTVKELTDANRQANGTIKEQAEIMQNNLQGSITKLTSAWEGLTNKILGSQGGIKLVVDLLTESVTGWTIIMERLGGITAEQVDLIKRGMEIVKLSTSQATIEIEKIVKPLEEAGDKAAANAKATELAAAASAKLVAKQKLQAQATEDLNKKEAEHQALFKSLNPLNNIKAIALEKELEQLKLRKIAADTEVSSLEAAISIYKKYAEQLSEAGGESSAVVRSIELLQKQLKDLQDEFIKTEIGTKRYIELKGLIVAKQEEIKIALGEETDAMKKAREEREKLAKQDEERWAAIEKEADNRLKKKFEVEQFITDRTALSLQQELDAALNAERLKRMSAEIAAEQTIEDAEKLDEALKKIKEASDAEELRIRNEHNANLTQIEADGVQAVIDAEKEKKDARLKAQQEGVDEFMEYTQLVADIAGALNEAIMAGYDNELMALQNSLDAGQISQEEFDQKRREIARRRAADERAAAIFGAIINTAQAVVSALAVGPPQGFILAAIAAALGASQIAIIASTPVPEFATGVIGLQGAGTETSDSIPAMLSRGESVMTAAETRKYRPILEAIRQGTLDEIIRDNYVRPAVDAALLNGFGDMGTSAMLQDRFNDMNLLRAIDRHRESDKDGFRYLAKELKRTIKSPKRGYA